MPKIVCEVCGKTGEKTKEIWLCNTCKLVFCKEHATYSGPQSNRVGTHELQVTEGGLKCPKGHLDIVDHWFEFDLGAMIAGDGAGKATSKPPAAAKTGSGCGAALLAIAALVTAAFWIA